MQKEIEGIQKSLENGTAEEVLKWAFEKYGNRVAIASSFGAEDVVLIDLAVKIEAREGLYPRYRQAASGDV